MIRLGVLNKGVQMMEKINQLKQSIQRLSEADAKSMLL